MTPLQQLEQFSNPEKASQMAAYHKTDRTVIGISNPDIDALIKSWRTENDVQQQLQISHDLWQSGVFEARIAAAKNLVQARIKDDEPVWQEIASWVPEFDGWALADHASKAGEKRLQADPTRLDTVETWTQSDHMWSRRAALVMTLPWAKLRNPKPNEIAQRERILGWVAHYTTDHDWFIQKSIGWWLRTLSVKYPDIVLEFIETHGEKMKPFARREALRKIKKPG